MTESPRCLICAEPLRNEPIAALIGEVTYDCPCCGRYEVTHETQADLPGFIRKLKPRQIAALVFAVRRLTDAERGVRLDPEQIERLCRTVKLPAGDQYLDELVLWIGAHTKDPGHTTDMVYPEYRGVLGAVSKESFKNLAAWAMETGWFTGILTQGSQRKQGIMQCALRPPGWQRYRDLTRAQNTSRFVFMAMKYGDPELDQIVEKHFAPEIARTGLELRRLDQRQPAGLIDDQLRVLIRTARMLVCDLTHGNRGAYWEAGFAEGLGKKVIYTCRRDVFEDRTDPNHPHFDTSHWVTVPWDPADPHPAAQKLKSHIRETLPLETRLEDA